MLFSIYTPRKAHNLVLVPLKNMRTDSKMSKIQQQKEDESHTRRVHSHNCRLMAGSEQKLKQEAPINRLGTANAEKMRRMLSGT